MLGLLSSRANRQGMNIAIVACILFTTYAFLTSTKVGVGEHKTLLLDWGRYNFTQHKLMLGVYSHLVVIVVGYVASLFFPRPDIDPNLLFSGWRKARRSALRVVTVVLVLLCGVRGFGQQPEKVRFTYEEGKAMLDSIASRYHSKKEWEERKVELRSCVLSRLGLSPLPARPGSKPIVTPWRRFDGYEVRECSDRDPSRGICEWVVVQAS
ncbi:hypothetical protein ACQ86N_33185 [Puia sp. P3]|uniref:hypothetical protein n=1 Tax=Puia sp. P3 TaxID=3423952 RepID=UPI003D66DC46